MPTLAKYSRCRDSQPRKLATWIDAGAAAKENSSCHHILLNDLNGRITRLTPRLYPALGRGMNCGSRHFSGRVNCRRATVAWLLLPSTAITAAVCVP
jgi:hypothetical protein